MKFILGGIVQTCQIWLHVTSSHSNGCQSIDSSIPGKLLIMRRLLGIRFQWTGPGETADVIFEPG